MWLEWQEVCSFVFDGSIQFAQYFWHLWYFGDLVTLSWFFFKFSHSFLINKVYDLIITYTKPESECLLTKSFHNINPQKSVVIPWNCQWLWMRFIEQHKNGYHIHTCSCLHCIPTWVRVRIEFEPLTGLWTIKAVVYYSYVWFSTFRQKFLGRGVSDSLSVVILKILKKIISQGCAIRWHHYVLIPQFSTLLISDINIHVDNTPISTYWMLNHNLMLDPLMAANLRWWSWQAEDMWSWT